MPATPPIVRKPEFDILKGLLIVTVVLGHTSFKIPLVDVFWFHMPAFFMVTGYLTRRFLTPADVIASARNFLNIYKLGGVAKYIFPYFAYCILFYLIFQPEPILKNIVRVLYAGSLNTTIYSFPFWYINALFVGSMAVGMAHSWKNGYKWLSLAVIWVVLHIGVLKLLPIPLPWGIDNALGAIVFLAVGHWAKKMVCRQWHVWLLLVPVAFVVLNYYGGLGYKINMKSMIYDHFLLDLIVPLSFTYLLYRISCVLTRVHCVSSAIAYMGRASITIYFTHAAILWVTRDVPYGASAQIAIALVVGLTLHALFSRYRLTRILFLGNLKKNPEK